MPTSIAVSDSLHDLCAYLELLAAVRGHVTTLFVADWRRLLSPLTSRQRRVVVLRALLGLEFAEIAERMGFTSWQAAYHHWTKAVAVLRREWDYGIFGMAP